MAVFASEAYARVTSINIPTTESSTFGGAIFGAADQYERFEGTVTGQVDLNDPRNKIIADVENAKKNADEMVGYSLDFWIIRPINFAKDNHRGTRNDSSSGNNTATAGDTGNGFLMNQGFTAAQGRKSFGVTLPIATNPNGPPIRIGFPYSFPYCARIKWSQGLPLMCCEPYVIALLFINKGGNDASRP
jgi:hypothetical protein